MENNPAGEDGVEHTGQTVARELGITNYTFHAMTYNETIKMRSGSERTTFQDS